MEELRRLLKYLALLDIIVKLVLVILKHAMKVTRLHKLIVLEELREPLANANKKSHKSGLNFLELTLLTLSF